MVKIARKEISTSNGHNFQTKKDNGYPLVPKFSSFRGLCVLTSLFHPLSRSLSRKSDKKGVPGGAQWGSMAQNMPLEPLYTEKKENLLAHTNF